MGSPPIEGIAGRPLDPIDEVLAGDFVGYGMDGAFTGGSRVNNHMRMGGGATWPDYAAGGNFVFNDNHVEWKLSDTTLFSMGKFEYFSWQWMAPGTVFFYPLR